VRETYILTGEISEDNMGPETYGVQDNLHGAILQLLLYGAPVWKGVLNSSCYKDKLIRIQRLINIKIAKAYCTVSNKAV
jgi:hypothetical protein